MNLWRDTMHDSRVKTELRKALKKAWIAKETYDRTGYADQKELIKVLFRNRHTGHIPVYIQRRFAL